VERLPSPHLRYQILAIIGAVYTDKHRDLILASTTHNNKEEALNLMISHMFVVAGVMVYAILVTLFKVDPPRTEPVAAIDTRHFYEVYWKELGAVSIITLFTFVLLMAYRRWVYRSKTSKNGWVTKEVRFNDFAEMNWEEESDTFTGLGHTWCLVAVTGNNDHLGKNTPTQCTADIGMYLQIIGRDQNTNINIDFSLAIKDSWGRILRLYNCDDDNFANMNPCTYNTNGLRVHYPTFSERDPYWGMNIGMHHLLNLFCLVDGALRVEVKMKLSRWDDSHKLETLWSRFKALYFTKLVSLRSSFKTLYSTKRLSYTSEDCPICLEPISQPWGVVTPCGHPCHVSCWDQVVTRHQRSDDGWESDDVALPSCVVCRKRATGFQQVYLALGSTGTSGDDKDRLEEGESSDEQGSSLSEESRQRRTSSVVGDRPRPLGSLPSENGSTRNRLLQAIMRWRRTRR